MKCKECGGTLRVNVIDICVNVKSGGKEGFIYFLLEDYAWCEDCGKKVPYEGDTYKSIPQLSNLDHSDLLYYLGLTEDVVILIAWKDDGEFSLNFELDFTGGSVPIGEEMEEELLYEVETISTSEPSAIVKAEDGTIYDGVVCITKEGDVAHVYGELPPEEVKRRVVEMLI